MRSALALVVVLWSATAQAAPDDAERRRAAKEHFQKGRAAYDHGDANLAIAEYQAAYQLLPFPDFVFNLAQAHRLKGNLEEAIRHYRLYLTLDPHGAAAEPARGYIDTLTEKLVQKRELEAQRAAEEQARRQRETEQAEEARLAAARAAPRPSSAPMVEARPAPKDDSRGRALRQSGIAVGAVGLAGLVLGAGFVGGAAAAHDDFFHPGNGVYSPAADDRQRTFERLDVAFFTIGGVALATGVVLYAVGRRP